MSSLSEIAHNGKIVILTIHQPRSDVFKMFDKIGLLSMGEMVYFGKSGQMVEYFQDLGYPCPTYASPLDHYGNIHVYEDRINSLCYMWKLFSVLIYCSMVFLYNVVELLNKFR